MATRLFAFWVHLESLSALFDTGYGRLLVLKLLIVAVVMGLGAINWKRLTPELGEIGGRDALTRTAATETVLANVVLVVTAILVHTSTDVCKRIWT